MPRFCYLVPVHNEGRIIPVTVERLAERLREFPGSSILLLENGSRDESAHVVRSLSGERHGVRIVGRSLQGKGLGVAYRAGVEWALREADEETVLVLSDADLPFEFTDLDSYLALGEGAKNTVVVGSKSHRQSVIHRPFTRSLMSAAFLLIRWLALGMRTRDCQGSYFVPVSVMRRLLPGLHSDGFFITAELAYFAERLGIPVKEVPVHHKNSDKPSTVKPVRDSLDMLRRLWALKTRMPDTSSRPSGPLVAPGFLGTLATAMLGGTALLILFNLREVDASLAVWACGWTVLFHLGLGLRLTRQPLWPRPRAPWVSLMAVNVFLAGVHPRLLMVSLVLTAGNILTLFRFAQGPWVYRYPAGLLAVTAISATAAAAAGCRYSGAPGPASPYGGYLGTDLFSERSPGSATIRLRRSRHGGKLHRGMETAVPGKLPELGTPRDPALLQHSQRSGRGGSGRVRILPGTGGGNQCQKEGSTPLGRTHPGRLTPRSNDASRWHGFCTSGAEDGP